MIQKKWYACSRCGYSKEIETNHFGECYSWGNYNACPDCPPHTRPTTWKCQATPPAGEVIPPPWAAATIRIEKGGAK